MSVLGTGVVTDDATATATLKRVGMPVMHFIADCGFREKDPAVGSNVEIVRKTQTTIVDYRIQGSVCFISQLFNLALRSYPVQPHATNTHAQITFRVESHAQGLAADVRIDFHFFIASASALPAAKFLRPRVGHIELWSWVT